LLLSNVKLLHHTKKEVSMEREGCKPDQQGCTLRCSDGQSEPEPEPEPEPAPLLLRAPSLEKIYSIIGPTIKNHTTNNAIEV